MGCFVVCYITFHAVIYLNLYEKESFVIINVMLFKKTEYKLIIN